MKYRILLAYALALLLLGCGSNNTPNRFSKTYTVKALPLHKSLYFTGIIQPQQESALTSPLDAVIKEMPLHFGQQVKKGEVLFVLHSTSLQKQYNEALTDYLKSKDSYQMAKAKFAGTENLWKEGLVAKNNYISEKSSLQTARLALIQAKTKFQETLSPEDATSFAKVQSLQLANFRKVKQLLATNHHTLSLLAPSDGLLLYPPKSFEDKSKRLSVGAAVKAGQVMALVGDLTGIRVEIDIPEVDVGALHAGMPATITGVALGKQTLQGTVVAVNAQALNSGTSGLPTFNALVAVKHLSATEQALIKVGMSATVALTVDKEKQLLIPIAAVHRQKGQAVVQVQGKGSRPISTGTIQNDTVVVESGLAVGDVVLYD
jgi:HlyD family secretion protein